MLHIYAALKKIYINIKKVLTNTRMFDIIYLELRTSSNQKLILNFNCNSKSKLKKITKNMDLF